MANNIFFGSSEIDDLKLGASQVDEIYLGAVLVWPPASGFVAGSISNVGNTKVGAGTYAATQFATSGSGTGATFNVTINAIRQCTAFTVTNGGSGYVTSDTVTLDVTGVSAGFQNPRIELTSA
jgi:hypothetical protein